jgi:hypothetical protein
MENEPKRRELEPDGDVLEGSSTPTGGELIKPQGTEKTPPQDGRSGSVSADGRLFGRFGQAKNFYLAIFIALLMIAIGVVAAAIKFGGDGSKGGGGTQNLSSEQLAELAGGTTLVGDPKQTLDIQGNAIFEGQVLARADLEIAGSLKVGGALSLPSVNIGDGSFNTLAVAGNSSLQGQLTVQGNLSVGGTSSFKTLSVSQLSVSSLQLTGDLTVSRHLVPSGGVPTKTNGSALGSGGTASVSGGDSAGTVTINTGGGPPAGCFLTVNFVNKYSTTPRVVISPSNSSSASLDYYTNRSTSGFSLCSISTPAAGTNYVFDYIVFD